MFSKIQSLLVKIGTHLQCLVLLVIRLYWGWQFILTGKGKLTHLDKAAEYFASLNIPMPKLNAILASSTELSCGLLLILGLFSRFASFALICVMCVASWTAERSAVLAIFSDPEKYFETTPFLFLYAAVLVFAFGPGKISIDQLIGKESKP